MNFPERMCSRQGQKEGLLPRMEIGCKGSKYMSRAENGDSVDEKRLLGGNNAKGQHVQQSE
jgi:hypothetical protein